MSKIASTNITYGTRCLSDQLPKLTWKECCFDEDKILCTLGLLVCL